MKDIKELTPFCYSALTSFPFIEKDFDALTEYELDQAIIRKINELIQAYNDGFSEMIKELIDKLMISAYYDAETETIRFNIDEDEDEQEG